MRRAGVADTRCSSAAEEGLPGTPAGLDVTPARHMLSDGFQEVLRNPSVSQMQETRELRPSEIWRTCRQLCGTTGTGTAVTAADNSAPL